MDVEKDPLCRYEDYVRNLIAGMGVLIESSRYQKSLVLGILLCIFRLSREYFQYW